MLYFFLSDENAGPAPPAAGYGLKICQIRRLSEQAFRSPGLQLRAQAAGPGEGVQ